MALTLRAFALARVISMAETVLWYRQKGTAGGDNALPARRVARATTTPPATTRQQHQRRAWRKLAAGAHKPLPLRAIRNAALPHSPLAPAPHLHARRAQRSRTLHRLTLPPAAACRHC